MKKKSEDTSAAIVLASLEKEAKPLIKSLQQIKVKDKDAYKLLAEKTKALKQLGKLAEAKEKSLIDPLKKVQKDIKELFAPFYATIKKLDNEAKASMLKLVEVNETKEEKIKNDLTSGKIVNLSTAVKKIADLSIDSNVRSPWVLEEIDAGVTPREYMVPDLVKIRAAFKEGKTVLGWKYVQKKTIAI
jgi:hypothetical protein